MELITTVSAFLLQYALRPLGIGRLRRNRVVFYSYFGSQYSCNPKYLSEYLEQHHPECELMWAFNNPEDFAFLRERGVELVRMNTPEFVRACLTARYIVTNSELPAWLPVTKRQTIINTWHGGGAYKRVGADFRKANRWKDLRSAIGRSKPCVYLSSSKAFTQLTIRESFQHTGEVLESGMPRNDLLVRQGQAREGQRDDSVLGDKIDAKVREALCIPSDAHILLYAPTYREDRTAATYLFDCARVQAALRKRFGGAWVILFRMHYLVMEQLPKDDTYVDASRYGDMQELLHAANMLVTDYSSSIWDFGLTGKPCVLYAPDLSTYEIERGFYSDIHTWPWPLTKNNEELAHAIEDFDDGSYQVRLAQHYADLGSAETGTACKTVAAYLAAHR